MESGSKITPNRLSIICDKLVEAGWLTVAIALPVLFDIYSEGVFEVDKACLLWSVALVMTLAWAIGTVGQWRAEQRQWMANHALRALADAVQRPLMLPVVLLVGAYLLSSCLSVWPHGSWWGSYVRRQGTYTVLSCVAIFFLAARGLRTREQWERLITLIVLTSLPVCLYAFLQRYGYDPMPWGRWHRVTSTLGNPIFVAAYLIMVVPLTIRQILQSLSGLRNESTPLISRVILVAGYTVTLLAQLLCILFTESRGPILGLAGGVFFFFALLSICRSKKSLGWVAISLAVAFGLFLGLLNLPQPPIPGIRRWSYVGRLTNILGARTFRQRVLTWDGVAQMSQASLGRALVGYGPETMRMTFTPYVPAELVEMKGTSFTQDRAHNETFDALATTGLTGMLAYLALFGSVFYYGLQRLGLVAGSRLRTWLVGLLVGGGVLGALVPWGVDGSWRLAGLGIPMGMIAGLGIYLLPFLFGKPRRVARGDTDQVLLIALLSAVLGHFVEIQSGITVTTTRAYFWIYTALMVALAAYVPDRPEPIPVPATAKPSPADVPRKGRRRRPRGSETPPAQQAMLTSPGPRPMPLLSLSLLVGLLLAVLASSFSIHNLTLSSSIVMAALFLVVWLMGETVVSAKANIENPLQKGPRNWSRSRLGCFLVPAGCCILSPLLRLFILRLSGETADLVVADYVSWFILMAAIAFSLLSDSSKGGRFAGKTSGWAYVAVALAIAVPILWGNLNVVRADIIFARGRNEDRAGNLDGGIALYRRALRLAPRQDRYDLFLGQAYLRKAQSDTGQRVAWFEEAQRALEEARSLNPLDPDHNGNLGNLYHYWAEITPDASQAVERLRIALVYYDKAMSMSPSNYGQILKEDVVGAHRSLALAYRALGQTDEALAEAMVARDLAPDEEKAEMEALIISLQSQGN